MKCISFSVILSLVAHSFATPLSSTHDTAPFSDLVRRDGSGSVTSAAGLGWYDANITRGTAGRSNPSSYTCFKGKAVTFPGRATWMNFKAMFALQKQVNLQYFDTPNQIQYIYNAILNISATAKVDPRVILGVIITESSGNVKVNCTTSYGGVRNCGLMQSYNPTVKAFDPMHQIISINQMVVDGTQGTAAGPGLVQWFNHAPDVSFDTAGNVYKVLRGYNSGAINMTNLSDGEGATDAYVSHVTNYMQGWDGSNGDAHASSCSFNPPSPTPTPTACSASAYVPAPTQTVAGSTAHCCKWYTVKSGDTCDKVDTAAGITLAQFRAWNTYVNAECTNIWANYAYCVSSNDPVPARAAAANAAPTQNASAAASSKGSSSTPTATRK